MVSTLISGHGESWCFFNGFFSSSRVGADCGRCLTPKHNIGVGVRDGHHVRAARCSVDLFRCGSEIRERVALDAAVVLRLGGG